jgi:acetyltransferase-like isoleucine patch superfamily enzyme
MLKSFGLFRLSYNIMYYFGDEIRSGRLWGVFWVGMANVMPDFYSCGFLRPIFWRVAGAQMADISNSVIRKNVFVEHPRNLFVGRNFQINRGSYLDASGPITIGDNVTISLDCRVLTISHQGANHEIDVIQRTTLKNNCIIYAGATVLPGSTVEDYVLLAAGAVLKGGTRTGGVYAGIPATFKGYRKDIDAKLFSTS